MFQMTDVVSADTGFQNSYQLNPLIIITNEANKN